MFCLCLFRLMHQFFKFKLCSFCWWKGRKNISYYRAQGTLATLLLLPRPLREGTKGTLYSGLGRPTIKGPGNFLLKLHSKLRRHNLLHSFLHCGKSPRGQRPFQWALFLSRMPRNFPYCHEKFLPKALAFTSQFRLKLQ